MLLLCRNEELSTKLKHEIEKLNRLITQKGGATTSSFTEDDQDPPEVTELKVGYHGNRLMAAAIATE